MKTRATSLMLAALAVVSFVLPALAAPSDEISEETPVVSPEIEEVHSAVRLDGEPVDTVEYEIRDGVCYVTVRSFVSMLDPEAMVEEENGVVRVSASTVTQVIPLYPEGQLAEGLQPLDPSLGENPVSSEALDPALGENPVNSEVLDPALGENPVNSEALDPALGENPVSSEVLDPALGGLDGAQNPDAVTNPAQTVVPADVVTADLDLQAAVGDRYFVANGRYLYACGGLIDLNGAVAVPVRQLAQVFNLTVGYDGENDLVLLSRQEGAEPYLSPGDETYDGDTMYWLSRIINAESGNQSLEGKIAVGNVVMNRVKNPRFPDNIEDVLFQKNQFTPAASGSIYREPNWESVVAAKLVLDGAQVTPDALFFNAAGLRSYASRTRTYVTTIGNHAFYK